MAEVRRGTWVGALAGAVAAGASAGVGVAVRRGRAGTDTPDPDEASLATPSWPAGDVRVRTVMAGDGVALHVEESGPEHAPLTVVLVHGYALDLTFWRLPACSRWPRTSGWSRTTTGRTAGRGAASPLHCTIDQLGERPRRRCWRRLVPTGPVVLVGHSMGGMTIMALADRAPGALRRAGWSASALLQHQRRAAGRR